MAAGDACKVATIVIGVLLTGTINTVVKKIQFGVSVKGYYNHSAGGNQTVHDYDKGWFQTYLMFIGELIILFGYIFYVCHMKRKFKNPDGSLNVEEWKQCQFSNR